MSQRDRIDIDSLKKRVSHLEELVACIEIEKNGKPRTLEEQAKWNARMAKARAARGNGQS